jgi:hypothetical protein
MRASTDNEPNAEVFELRPLSGFKSQGDLLAYIERTRRQLDRFEQLPKSDAQRMDPNAAARIRTMCDELESDILAGLAGH